MLILLRKGSNKMNEEKVKNVKRDKCITDEHLSYLDILRETGGN